MIRERSTTWLKGWKAFVIGLLPLALSPVIVASPTAKAQEPPAAPTPQEHAEDKGGDKEEKPRPNATQDPPGLKRLMPKYDVWIDPKRKLVVVQGRVCLRRGALEMFACPQGTKEHESIVALNCKAFHIHAALVAIGAKPISPVKFNPNYEPASGTTVDIEVLWKDAKGVNQRVPAQKWINDAKDKPLKYSWVFGGSRFYKDEETGKEIYLAEDGDLICVSNFTTATLDLPIPSTADAGNQLFYANSDAIPQMDTVVRLVLKPQLDDKKEPSRQPEKKQEE